MMIITITVLITILITATVNRSLSWWSTWFPLGLCESNAAMVILMLIMVILLTTMQKMQKISTQIMVLKVRGLVAGGCHLRKKNQRWIWVDTGEHSCNLKWEILQCFWWGHYWSSGWRLQEFYDYEVTHKTYQSMVDLCGVPFCTMRILRLSPSDDIRHGNDGFVLSFEFKLNF